MDVTNAVTQWSTRLLYPKIMEFKVISREREKHEFMPVIYLIHRSTNWLKRVPRRIEQQMIEDYIAPLLTLHREQRGSSETGFSKQEMEMIGGELRRRTELLNTSGAVCTDESSYKLGLLVNYSPLPSLHKSELFQVIRQVLTTLSSATHQRALIVPVNLHFCADGSVFGVQRYAGVRYGAPALLEARDVQIFREDPLEMVHHISAKLMASLKMLPPQTAAQMEILRLSRSLHVYCAKVYRDDCFSRRQIASMNEEILQIHFRTRNHPDMHALKIKMQDYCTRLKKWKLRDEDINAATVAATTPKNPIQVAGIVASIALRFVATPWRLLVSGVSDFVYRPQQRKLIALASMTSAFVKCTLAFLLFGVLVHAMLLSTRYWWSVCCVFVLIALHLASPSFGYEDVAAHWKKIQFYVMDRKELNELKDMRAILARRIHAIVAQYVSADLPPPVASRMSPTNRDEEYFLNPHHKIFINAPRSFPLDYAENVEDTCTARRAVYAPKMLRDETWRQIYGTLAPAHLQFAALLADNKGDSLPMERLLSTPFFNAVLAAYVIHHKKSHGQEDDELVMRWIGELAHAEATPGSGLESFASVKDLVDAALDLAQEAEELSS
ncbi:hypothetical protein Poli38472_008851 [Pythium oligandrum]|uniref:Uncharacterized protein n=1 Tax=Pythium oligandrum TaxID=41045 RepID=A0A8K1FEV3_PYTOL|nr:hypothetical protein Poli38472_008851 [Pythium oligandrum]|eukprot:TMW56203.1 hypothetical protein Poli38472_008851 [Pythium oligandrum]